MKKTGFPKTSQTNILAGSDSNKYVVRIIKTCFGPRQKMLCVLLLPNVYVHVCVYIHIYIYIYRERERYIHIYREREIDRLHIAIRDCIL